MKFSPSLFTAVALATVGFSLSVRADITLVKDGQPVATIVADAPGPPPPADPGAKKRGGKLPPPSAEEKAVATLVTWIEKITGARLPVAAEAPKDGPAIFVGKAAIKAGLKLDDIESVSREGVRIVADDKRVLIGGQRDEATLKAACRFLEELGCRYFMDGPLGEVYPQSKTLTVGKLSITEKPGLIGRNPKGPSWPDTGWRAWNGDGGDMVAHSHSWGAYVKESEFEKHPEWFAMGSDGQRKAGGWICTSNPELRKHFAQGVIAAIEAGSKHPSISPTDGRGYCQCDKCKAQDDPKSFEPSSGTLSVTNRYTDFFDDVARQVAKVHPESVVSFIAYADYTQPPTVDKKLSPNLCCVIAPIRYCRLHPIGHPDCPSRSQQLELTDGWAKVADKLGYYNYMYNLADGTLPMFKFTACKTEFPYLYSKGTAFMTIEVLSNWHIYGPQIYLSLRMAYNPEADADAIMEDYWQKFYGPKAGPHMKDYWMGIDQAMTNGKTHAGCFYGLQQIYTPEFLKTCRERLDKAAAAAKGNEAYEQRVALHTAGYQNAADYREISDRMAKGDFQKANATLDTMTARMKNLTEKRLVNPEYATAYIERFLAKPVRAGAAITAAPNKIAHLFSDKWRFAVDRDDHGNQNGWHEGDFDDSTWQEVSTYPETLDVQGTDETSVFWYRSKFPVAAKHGKLVLFCGENDGPTEVYVNGKKIPVPMSEEDKKKAAAKKAVAPTPGTPPAREGQGKGRTVFEVDVTDAVKTGENTLALRIDHTRISELSLGGILRPVMIVEKP